MIPDQIIPIALPNGRTAIIRNGCLNFIGSGMMGDFLHTMYAVKHLCKKHNAKANITIANGYHGDIWKYGVEKAYNDLYRLILAQPYVNSFAFLPNPPPPDNKFSSGAINLNTWRESVATTHATTGKYDKCWTDVLSQEYGFTPPEKRDYAWLELDTDKHPLDANTYNSIVIHRSKHRHNGGFPWQKIMEFIANQAGKAKIQFVTCDPSEYEAFPFKIPNLELYQVNDIYEMANAIRSASLFFGNMSTPLVLASAFDRSRMAELDHDPAPFYLTETNYTQNLQYYLDDARNTEEYREFYRTIMYASGEWSLNYLIQKPTE